MILLYQVANVGNRLEKVEYAIHRLYLVYSQ